MSRAVSEDFTKPGMSVLATAAIRVGPENSYCADAGRAGQLGAAVTAVRSAVLLTVPTLMVIQKPEEPMCVGGQGRILARQHRDRIDQPQARNALFKLAPHQSAFEGVSCRDLTIHNYDHDVDYPDVGCMFEPAIERSDASGGHGDVNRVTAGSGSTHSERFERLRREGGPLDGIQAWVALPDEREEMVPGC